MSKSTYTYIKKASLEYLLSNFDTVYLKVSYMSQLKEILAKLEAKQFDISYTQEKWKQKWAQSCINNDDPIAVEIDVQLKFVDLVSYQHITSELSELHYWSIEKLRNLGKIAVSEC